MGKPIIVYTAGVFDLFHIGHLNVLQNARGLGDRLVVGVSTDELVERYKGRRPVIPFEERIRIVGALKCVDVCIPQYDLDKYAAWERIGYDVLVIGDDWYGVDRWMEYKARLEEKGVRVVFLPYTRGVSSSQRRALIRAEGKGPELAQENGAPRASTACRTSERPGSTSGGRVEAVRHGSP